jgi:hypothetical protein
VSVVRLSSNTTLLAGLKDCLLTQVDAPSVDDVLPVVSRPGGGLVLVGERSIAIAEQLTRGGFLQPILTDRRRYAGKQRAVGTSRFDPRWIVGQQQCALPAVLTDSGYIGQNDFASLDSVLTQTAALGPGVIATLPLHTSWLRRNRKGLTAAIDEAAVPVALILKDRDDPLATKATLVGLVSLLRSVSIPVLLLSCDVSALGALAFGAHAAAVGTRTGLRHLYPTAGGGPPQDDMESAFIRDCLAFRKVGRVAQAVAADPDDPMWVCWCQFCMGRRLDWLLTASRLQVRGHSIELLLDLRDHLTQGAAGPSREQSWKAQCASAQFQHEAIQASGVFWGEPPSAIRRWQEM